MMEIEHIYINKVKYCCPKIEDYIKMYRFIIWGEKKNEARLNAYSPNKIDWLHDVVNYCPFCGEKMEFIVDKSDFY